jgi:hypothetical protein
LVKLGGHYLLGLPTKWHDHVTGAATPISAEPANLLRKVDHVARTIHVDDRSNMGVIHSHAKSTGGHHDLALTRSPLLQAGFFLGSLARIRVVDETAELVGQLIGFRTTLCVHNHPSGRLAEAVRQALHSSSHIGKKVPLTTADMEFEGQITSECARSNHGGLGEKHLPFELGLHEGRKSGGQKHHLASVATETFNQPHPRSKVLCGQSQMEFIKHHSIQRLTGVQLTEKSTKRSADGVFDSHKDQRTPEMSTRVFIAVTIPHGKADVRFFAATNHVSLEDGERGDHHSCGSVRQTGRQHEEQTFPFSGGEDRNDLGVTGDNAFNDLFL